MNMDNYLNEYHCYMIIKDLAQSGGYSLVGTLMHWRSFSTVYTNGEHAHANKTIDI